MGFSNLVALFIILTTAVTLNAHGITSIQTTEQAAEALRPLAGEQAFLLFTLGIVGTGMLAVPILAGSAAYAVAEMFEWRTGLGLELRAAKGFYGILAAAMVVGVVLDFNGVDPIKELFWAAVINGVIAVPIMVVMMLLAQRRDVMGPLVVTRRLRVLGWLATLVMALAVGAMFVTTSW
jgi:Mn2+/Fe2+ NRAMP family transporter